MYCTELDEFAPSVLELTIITNLFNLFIFYQELEIFFHLKQISFIFNINMK